MKYTFELSDETIDDIVANRLVEAYEGFQRDLGSKCNMFYYEEHEKDDAEIQKHIDATILMMKWFMNPDKLKELNLD